MSASPLAGWRSNLRRHGFTPNPEGVRRGIHMMRQQGPISQAIRLRHHQHRVNDFCVVLHLGMTLRCSEPSYEILLLTGDLSETGVRIQGPRSHHEPGSTNWWPEDRLTRAWHVLEEYGLDWLERYSDVAALTDHLERELDREWAASLELPQESPPRLLARALRGDALPVLPKPYQGYLLWLSMLHEEQGRIEDARTRLEEYAAIAPMLGGEPERLERHRKALEARG